MALEVGSILEGKVTGITKFGAFVELTEGKTGMVHISEVATTYVKEIRDFLKENQIIKVKIMAVSDDGKINLSIKRAMEQAPRRQFTPAPRKVSPGADVAFSKSLAQPQNFEDMMSKFRQTSDDRMSDIKRNLDGKHGATRKYTK